jgi:hypothetical protein
VKGERGKAPAIQWYYKDWLSDRGLQMAAPSTRGIWMNILMYMIDCSLDGDGCEAGNLENLTMRRLAALGACSQAEAEVFVEEALELGFCDIHVTSHGAVTIMSRRLKRDAKKRVEARRRKREERLRNKEKGGGHTDVTPESPDTPFPTPTPTPKNNTYTSEFESWWELYPRRVGKKKAYRSWLVAVKDVDEKTLIFRLRQQVSADHFKGTDGKQYIPLPTTWLNQGRWDDEIKQQPIDIRDARAQAAGEYMRRKRAAKHANNHSGAGDNQLGLPAPKDQ